MAEIIQLSDNPGFKHISGKTTFTGLASGTDFDKIVTELVKVESINMRRQKVWKAEWEAKVKSMQSLNSRLNAVEEGAKAIDTQKEFMQLKAITSNSTALDASVESSASPGAYAVTVGKDVKNIKRSNGVADTGTTAMGGAGGTMWFEVNGSKYQVAVLAGDTLNNIVNKLNNNVLDESGAAVASPFTASIEDDGTSSNKYHLKLISKTGGNKGSITILQNPTDLNLSSNNMAIQDTTGFGVSGNVPTISLAGQFGGDKSEAATRSYNFQVTTAGGPHTIGSDAFTLTVTPSVGAAFTVDVPADYIPGNNLEVEEGIYIQLGAGQVETNDTFSVRGFSNSIDEVELGATYNGTSKVINTSGNYQGSINKTYSFYVTESGSINSGGTQDTVVIRWTDSTGETGTISVSDTSQAYELDDGVKIQFANAGTLAKGDIFQLNVTAAELQQGQDKGLARASKVVHSGFADKDETAITAKDATFTYTYAGRDYSVSIKAGQNLNDLMNAINNDEKNPGVNASIINDGLGLPNSYKLVLTGKATGAANQITNIKHTFDNSAFGNDGKLGGGFSTTQKATNSMVQVDGFPSGDEYLQRATNKVNDVVSGMTLNLRDAGTSTVTVSTDVDKIVSNIEKFINAVNYAQKFIQEETKYIPKNETTKSKKSGILIGNYAYQLLDSRINTKMTSSVEGLKSGIDPYSLLSQIGIESDPDANGQYKLDKTKLRKALNDNPDAVMNVFIKNDSKGSVGVAARMAEEMEAQTDPETGSLNVLIKNYQKGIIAGINSKIESEERRLKLYEKRLKARFVRLETAMAKLNGQNATLTALTKRLSANGKKETK